MLIYPENPNEFIRPAKDKNLFLRQGVEPKKAQAEGLVLSSEWKTFVNGREIITYSTPVTHMGPQSFAVIDLESVPLCIEVEYAGPLREAKVLPRELGIAFEIRDNRICFMIEKASNIVIEANHSSRSPLALFVSPQEEVPNPEDSKVLWFAPGIHRIDYLELQEDQILYLAPGAIIKAKPPQEGAPYLIESDWAGKKNYYDFIFATEKKNIKICGKGMIDTSGLDWHDRRSMVFSDCSHITVSGITLIGAAHWTMPFFGCTEITVENVKILGYRENRDGINLVDCAGVSVTNCFIRTGDDAVCVKSMGLNKRFGSSHIRVRVCIAWNDKVRAFGIAGETRYEIRDILFEDCQVLCSAADWTREVGALCIVISDSATIHKVTFRRIGIRQENNYVINCKIMKDMWSTDMDAGHIENITFEDILIPENAMIYLEGYDNEHQVRELHFKGIKSYEKGKEVEIDKYMIKNDYVELSTVE